MTQEATDPTNLPIFAASGPPAAVSPPAPGGASGAHALAGRIHPVRPHAIAAPSLAPTEAIWMTVSPGRDAGPAPSARGLTSPMPVESPRSSPAKLDWQLVKLLRTQATDQLTGRLGDERGQDSDAERELGRMIIKELLLTADNDRIHAGKPAWGLDEQHALATAVYDALFGLGRLQPYVDDETVENIIVSGWQNVWLERTDGSMVRVEPIADSDAELEDFLQFLASRSDGNARSFSSASPTLHMTLDDGSRLAAASWVTRRPIVVIRRHRLVRVTLADLVERGMLTAIQASLLSAAVKAGLSIVVSGPQGAGKTTLIRALCNEIPPSERIGTFETEYELHLDLMPDLHPFAFAFEARPGSGEVGPDGKRAGEYTLDEALMDSYRLTLQRQIVGEIRGQEVWTMIKAMESGSGSLSTTHAKDGEAAMRKLITCAMEGGQTKDVVAMKLADAIDLIVQVELETEQISATESRRSRWVSEILHVTSGEALKGYATTHVYKPNPEGGHAIPGTIPEELRFLDRKGFNLTGYLASGGEWTKAVA